jgi:hypothetical protein
LAYKWDINGILLEYIWHINGIYMEYSNGILLAGWWFQPTPLKNDGVSSSVGMMTFPTEWKVKFMFQTTSQVGTGHRFP